MMAQRSASPSAAEPSSSPGSRALASPGWRACCASSRSCRDTASASSTPPPQARELIRALRHPDVSVVVDLSKLAHATKREYLRTLLPLLLNLRRSTGLPHKILLDEAHYFLQEGDITKLVDPVLGGYIFVTYRISSLPALVREQPDSVVMVTRETDRREIATLLGMCRPQPVANVSPRVFRDLQTAEAALLPGAEEAHGQVRRFQLAPRLTAHVRHCAKYLDMPVLESQALCSRSRDARSQRPGR